jgi:mono/diheme cytochrome c family protein
MKLARAGRAGGVLVLSMLLASCQTGSRSLDPAGADTVGQARRHARDGESGARIFRGSCAACHGEDARGNGPVAPLLTVQVPDLTRIAARRHGEFPGLEVFRIIDGQSELAAHGPRHMPVWGYEFFGDDADDEIAHRRASGKIDRLVEYLRSIQRE